MTELYGFILLYVIPGGIAYVFWRYPIRRLIALWVGRDVMLRFIPKPADVHHTERLLGIRTRQKPTP